MRRKYLIPVLCGGALLLASAAHAQTGTLVAMAAASTEFPLAVTVDQLPAAGGGDFGVRRVTDGMSGSDCTVGEGSEILLCMDTGAAWTVVGSGAGGGAPTGAEYVTTAANGSLSAERVLQAGTNTTVTSGAGTVQIDISGTLADARVDGSAESDEVTLAGDVDGAANAGDLDEVAVESELEAVLDLSDLQGAVTDAQVPNGITVDLATAATALAANGTNCSAGNYPLGVDASGNVESCTAAGGGIGGSTGATDNAILRADGTGGSTAQSSSATVDDSGNVVIAGTAIYGVGGGSTRGYGYENAIGPAIYAPAGEYIRFRQNGSARWHFNPNTFNFEDSSGTGGTVTLRNNATGATDPGFSFTSDLNSGLGWAGADDARLIAGGSSVLGFARSGSQNMATIYGAMQLTPQSAPPVTCGSANTAGVIYFDSDSAEACLCDGVSWTGLKAGGACA